MFCLSWEKVFQTICSKSVLCSLERTLSKKTFSHFCLLSFLDFSSFLFRSLNSSWSPPSALMVLWDHSSLCLTVKNKAKCAHRSSQGSERNF